MYPDKVFGPSVKAFTVSTWTEVNDIKAADNPYGQQHIIYKSPEYGEYQLLFLSSGYIQFGVKLKNGKWHEISAPAEGKQFYNVTATYHRGNNIELWINGKLISELQIPSQDLFVTSGFTSSIGAYNSSSRFLKGIVDEVKIYNRKLAPLEIKKIANLMHDVK